MWREKSSPCKEKKNMLTNLLVSWPTIALWVLVIGAVVALYFFNKRAQQKREDEINSTLNALKPGNKVKTIGGICGVVVEVCPEDDTFILETGSENSGKSYIKFDKKSIYQTDAKAAPAVEEVPAEEAVESVENAEEAPFEEVAAPAEECVKEAVEETPVEEAPAEETAEEVENEEE